MSRIAAIGSWGDLKSRFISAFVLGIAVIGVTAIGGFPFRLLCVAIGVVVFDEWARMTRSKKRAGPIHRFTKRSLYIVLLLFLFGLNTLSLLVLVAAAAFIAFIDRSEKRAFWTLGGLAYASLAALSLGFLRADDGTGLLALGYVVVIVWASDIFAYFTGRSIGGPKLMPFISPKKTISGAVGGLVMGVVCAWIYLEVLTDGASFGHLFLAACLSIVGQIGDLFESWIKRRFGVKDSGRMIPGHGGVMDRMDALIVAVAMAWLVGAVHGGLFDPARGLF